MKEITGTDVMRWIDRHDAKSKVSMRLKTYLAGAVVCAAFWGLTAYTVFADGLVNATVLGLDRVLCKIQVDQKDLDLQVVIGAIERDITISQAMGVVVASTGEIMDRMAAEPKSRTVAYCDGRRGY